MKPGLYLVASLDGESLPPDCLAPIAPVALTPGTRIHKAPDCHIALIDPDPNALDLWSTPTQVCAFTGFLDEPEALASTLGLPPDTRPAQLAFETLARYAHQASHRMLGEWAFALWQPAARSLSLLSSRARRDLLSFHATPARVAVAPDALALARLFAREPELHPVHFALQTSRYDLRHTLGDQSLWRDTCELTPSTLERFTPGQRKTQHATEPEPATSWQGSFDDSIDQLQTVGLRLLGQHLHRHPSTAFHLSGGQDSTLLTGWAAQARTSEHRLVALCSAAPPGSGLRDESAYSQAAADQLGIPLQLIAPPPEWNLFAPPPALFRFRQHPLMEEAQPANQALQQAAHRNGASALISGLFGELSVTGGQTNPAARSWLRNRREQLREWTRARNRNQAPWTEQAFYIRFAPEFLQQLPLKWRDIWLRGTAPFDDGTPGRPIGIPASIAKANLLSTAAPDGLRVLLPFRDRRLLEAAAALPSDLRLHAGLTRALSRELLRGHVPEHVRLRTEKLPFAPDFPERFTRQAPLARARIPVFADAALGSMLDLPWLAAALDRAAAGQVTHPADRFQIQSTAVAAEFLLWLRSGAPAR